jgi:hypothetical protein
MRTWAYRRDKAGKVPLGEWSRAEQFTGRLLHWMTVNRDPWEAAMIRLEAGRLGWREQALGTERNVVGWFLLRRRNNWRAAMPAGA